MIKVVLDREALNRVRLVPSPMWELACSLRLLLHRPDHRMHAPWLRWAGGRVASPVLATLRAVMPSAHRFPDMLTPPPGDRPRSFRSELATFAAGDPEVARSEIVECWDGAPPAAVSKLLDEPGALMPRLAEAIDEYWGQVLAPVWGNLRSVHSADLAYRADALASTGLRALLDSLHPTVRFDGRVLGVENRRCDFTRQAGGEGLTLVPCAFAWPEVLIVDADPYPVTLSYSPRGTGVLWQAGKSVREHPLAGLIGRSRAAILALLDLPLSNTQLTELTRMSAPAISQHLAVLRRCGLVEARRSGRVTVNARTQLGCALLAGATER